MITIGSVTGFNTVTKTTASSPTTAVGDMVLANAVGGVVTVTLPTAPPTNSQVVVKKIDTSANAVNVGSSANIDNVATISLTAPNAAATFTYDGATWRISGTALDVPSGGAAGQVLTKNTSTSYDMFWAPASSGSSGAGQQWGAANSNRWFMPGYALPAANNSIATSTSMSAFPIYIPNACTLKNITASVGGSGLTFKVALYGDTGSGMSTVVGAATSFFVNAASSGSGVINWVVPAAGVYWLAYALSVANPVMSAYPLNPLQVLAPGATGPWYQIQTTAAYYYNTATWPSTLSGGSYTPVVDRVPVFGFQV